MLSHPLSRFRRSEPYWVGYEDAKFCTQLGLIPTYAVNLDRYTLLRLWGERARSLFSPRAEPVPEEDYVYWKMVCERRRRLPELSSMNFVLKQSADLTIYQGADCECFKQYFTFGFWCFPESGFSDSTIVLNDDSAVHLVLKASKSLYIPGRTYVKEMDLGLEKRVPVEMLTLWGLRRKEGDYYLHRIDNVVLTKGTADALEEEQDRGRFLVNGIVSEFRKRESRFPTLTSVALYEISNLELIMSTIGIVVSQRFQNDRTMSRVGTLGEVKTETEHVLKILLRKASLDRTFADSMPDQFSLALNYLGPIVVTDKIDVFYMHPSVYVSLLSTGLIHRLLKDDITTANLLKIVDMIPVKSDREILRSEENDYLKSHGIFLEILLPSLKIAIRQMQISRFLRKTPEILEAKSEEEIQETPSKGEIVLPSIKESAIDVLTKEDEDILRYLEDYERKLRKARRDR
jgi:hypothetical protein